MKSVAADAAGRLARATGLDRLALHRRANALHVPMYHGICAREPAYYNWCQIPEDRFERQLDYLAARFRLIGEEELVAHLVEGDPLPPRAALLTFDDGFATNRTRAFPRILERGVPATIFLTTALIGTDRVPWPEAIFLRIEESGCRRLDLRDWGLTIYDLTVGSDRAEAYVQTMTHVKRYKPSERTARIAELFDRLGEPVRRSPARHDLAPMSWEQAREMQESGLVTFGGHTRRHEILERLDDETLEREIHGCCEDLERQLGRRPRLFAYPNGRAEDFDDRAKSALRAAGVVAAFSTITGANRSGCDPLELRRFGVGADLTFGKFVLNLSGLLAALRPPSLSRWTPA